MSHLPGLVIGKGSSQSSRLLKREEGKEGVRNGSHSYYSNDKALRIKLAPAGITEYTGLG